MDGRDKLAVSSATPDVQELLNEWRRASRLGDDFSRRDTCENTRYAYWETQDATGKKLDRNMAEGKQAFPWDGASDTRVRMADTIVNDNVQVGRASFSRAEFSADGFEASDVAQVASISKLLSWARNSGIPSLASEQELLFQYRETFGWGILHIVWERKLAKRRQSIGMDEILALSKDYPPDSVVGQLPAMISDVSTEVQAANVVQQMYADFVMGQSPGILAEEITGMDVGKARKIVRDLRKWGQATFPVPYVKANNPRVIALEPYVDVFFPPETTDLQRARVIFRRDWMTEAELLAAEKSEGWKREWINKVIQMKGRGGLVQNTIKTIVNDSSTYNIDDKTNEHEVVWAYTKQVDEDGVECVYYTVFSPQVGDGLYGAHEDLDYAHGEYPFVVDRREVPKRKITESRGVPEIAFTWQQEKKVQRDSLVDRTSLSVLPPLKVSLNRKGAVYRLGPGAQVPEDRAAPITWMEPPPGNAKEAVEVMREIDRESDQYFGRFSEWVSPVMAQLKQQAMIDSHFDCWRQAFKQIYALCVQFLTDEELSRITGSADFSRSFELIQRSYDWRLKFDVRNLDTDFVTEKIRAFNDFVVATDAAGVVDRAKYTMFLAQAIDPTIARAVVQDQGTASQQLFRQVNNDVALMALGNEAEYVENDPTAGSKLQFLRDIVTRNPKYLKQLESDQSFQELLGNYEKNLSQSVTQEQNKMVGRIGVQPLTRQGAGY